MAGLSVRKFTDGVLLGVVVTGIGFMGMKADVAGAGCGEVTGVSIGRNSDGAGAREADVAAAPSMGRKSDGAGAKVLVVAAAPSRGRNSDGAGAPGAVVVSEGTLGK